MSLFTDATARDSVGTPVHQHEDISAGPAGAHTEGVSSTSRLFLTLYFIWLLNSLNQHGLMALRSLKQRAVLIVTAYSEGSNIYPGTGLAHTLLRLHSHNSGGKKSR